MFARNKCFVPGCNTGCNLGAKPGLNDGLNKKTLFKAPEDKNLLERWRRNIPKVGKYLIPGISVCEVHFKGDSIERFKETTSASGQTTLARRSTPILKPGAVPTIFPNFPTSLLKSLKKIDPPSDLRRTAPLTWARRKKRARSKVIDLSNSDSEKDDEMPVNDNEISSSHMDSENDLTSSKSKTTSGTKSSSDNRVTSSTQDSNTTSLPRGEKTKDGESVPSRILKKPTRRRNHKSILEQVNKKINESDASDSSEDERDNPASSERVSSVVSINDSSFDDKYQILVTGFDSDGEEFSFHKLKSDIFDIKMPTPQWSYSCLHEAIAFINWAWYYETRKKIIVTKNLVYRIFVRDKEIKIEGYEGPKSLADVNEMLQVVETIPVCWGLGPEKGWSKNCTGHVPYREGTVKNSAKRKCDACLEECRITPVEKKKQERRKKKLLKLVSTLSSERSKNKLLNATVQRLKKRNATLSMQLGYGGDTRKTKALNREILLDKMVDVEFTSPKNHDLGL